MNQPTEPITQLRIATALVDLIQEDAPAATWDVAERGRRLTGQIIMPTGTDTDRRRALAAWQRILGAGPVTSSPVGHTEHISVSGSYEGIPVRVVTIVDIESAVVERLAKAADALGDTAKLTGADLRALIAGGGDAA